MAVSDQVTAAMVNQLRRMVDEPTESTYDDSTLISYIARHPRIDERGEKPYTYDTLNEPPTFDDNDDWIATFCLHSAAAEIWEEKAAGTAELFNFDADGGSFSQGDQHVHYKAQARFHRSRRIPKAGLLIHETRAVASDWIGNLAEEDD